MFTLPIAQTYTGGTCSKNVIHSTIKLSWFTATAVVVCALSLFGQPATSYAKHILDHSPY